MIGRIISIVIVLVIVGVGISQVVGKADRDDSGKIEEEGDLSVFDLKANDCVTDLPKGDGEQTSVKATPCEKSHEGEVFTIIDLGDADDFPGEAFVNGKAERGCPARLKRLKPAVDVSLFYFTPTKASWEGQDDHSVTCIAVYEKPVVGALKDQKAT